MDVARSSASPDTGTATADGPSHDDEEKGRQHQASSGSSDTTQVQEHDNSVARKKSAENVGYIKGLKLFVVMTSVTTALFLLLLDLSILSTAIPKITSDFHSLHDVGWYVGAYQLACASLQPLSGKLFTYFNSKWTYLIFFLVFEIGSLICGFAVSSTMLIIGRAVSGMGASGLTNGGLTVISGAIPVEKRPLYLGILIGVGQVGMVVGPLIGGALTEYTTWRWCFWINLPIGVLSGAVLIFTQVPDLTEKPVLSLAVFRKVLPELDLSGFALFAPASIMFLMALECGGNEWAWDSATTIGLFCGAGLTAILFVVWEYRMGDMAMIPGPIVGRRVVWSSIGQASLLMSTVLGASNFLPIYFQAVRGAGPTMSGVYLLPSILAQLFAVVVSGFLVSRLGYYLPFPIFSGALNAVANGLMSTLSPTTETAKWVGYQILMGAARGLGLQMGIVAVQNALPAPQIPVSLASVIFGQNFAGALTIVIATTIFTQGLRADIVRLAPSVSPSAAIAAGGSAEGVKLLVPDGGPELDGVLLAYSNSVDKVFYLMAACSVLSFVFSWGMGWTDVRKKEKEKEKAGGGEGMA